MTRLEKIEAEIRALDPEELSHFRAWFDAFEASRWDARFEDDVASGRLDRLAERAVEAHRSGGTRPL